MLIDEQSPESSPAETPAAADTAVQNLDQGAEGTKAESSPAKDVSLLDAVKASLKPKTGASSASTDKDVQKPEGGAASEDEEPEPTADPTKEELARYHSKTRKQVTRLLDQRRDLETKVKDMTPDAEGFRKITAFINDSGMSKDEFNILCDVGRNMKQDPHRALEMLRPYVEKLLQVTGEALPADLKQQVDQGYLTEANARELARTRSKNQVLEQRTQRATEADRQRQEQDRTQRHVGDVQGAISTWETGQAKNDPDWKLKQERIGNEIELEVRRNGFPKTTAAAVELANKALERVNADMARFAPRKTNVQPLPNAGSPRPVVTAPKTALDAVRQSLQRRA